MSQAETWTVTRLLQWTQEYLEKYGSESPRLDAEVLLGHAAGCARIELYARFQEPVEDDVKAQFRELVKQRAAGTPVAYLVGNREFYSLKFEVTRDVLIPRPETETLVLESIELAKPLAESARALDVCTGSGVIAVCLAKYTRASVTAIDLSPEALAVARRNAATHQVDSRIDFRQGDLLQPLEAEQRFHVIASNPPYVSESEYAELDASVRDYEPRMALLAGPEGSEFIERLAKESLARLEPDGWLLIELSPMIADRCLSMINALGYRNAQLLNDLQGRARVLKAQAP